MNPNPADKLRPLHQLYCSLTDRGVPWSMALLYRWELWDSHGWTAEDLQLVIHHIKVLIKQDRRRPGSFRMNNLLDPERFGEDLAEAKAIFRPRPRVNPGKAQVLRATGRRSDPPEITARSAAQILACEQAFKKFQELRKSL